MTNQTKALLAVLGATTFAGSGIPVFSKIILRSLQPEEMMVLRFFIASVVFLPWIIKFLPRKISDWLKISFVTLPAVINMILFANGVQFSPAITAQLIYAFSPVATAIIVLLIGQEKLNWQKISGIMIGLMGMFIILTPSLETLNGNLKGNILLLLGMLSWSIYTIASKPLNQQFSSSIISFNLLANGFLANFILGGWSVFSPEKLSQIPSLTWIWIIYLSLVGSIGFFYLYQLSIKLTSAITASMMQYLTPVITFMWAAILLQERLNWWIVIGGILTIGGAYLVTNKHNEVTNKHNE